MLDREVIDKAATIQFGKDTMVACEYKWGWRLYSRQSDLLYAVKEVDGKVVFEKM